MTFKKITGIVDRLSYLRVDNKTELLLVIHQGTSVRPDSIFLELSCDTAEIPHSKHNSMRLTKPGDYVEVDFDTQSDGARVLLRFENPELEVSLA